MTGPRWMLAVALVVLALAPRVDAYLKLGVEVDGRIISLRWVSFPVQYFITDRDDEHVSAAELEQTVRTAFETWTSVPTASLSASFAGFTSAEPFADDGLSVIGFQSQPDEDRTLGAAVFEFEVSTGRLVSSDIFFNTIFDWSVAPDGQAGRFDLESVVLHELGHLLGLGHSALGETEIVGEGRSLVGKRAVMFPIAYSRGSIEDRTLEADDIAGLGDIYSTSDFNRDLGAISGRVRLGGSGVFGAHVTVLNIRTGALVSGYALSGEGEFVIAGLEPGLYVVRAEPLDDVDLESVFDEDTEVNVDFRPAYHPQLVGVPAGGAGRRIDVTVVAK
ncbi:MAG TPA: carboxypeptidase-like regulatory domain-containing protein [Vicinamibacterales bacterium]|nr:carboxypeptidase-like regulatory domain-containing protein [Vicinamibacterales bacterium]